MTIAILIIIFALVFRLLTLTISQKNEAQLIKLNSIEYGVMNSKVMSSAWVLLYLLAVTELLIRMVSVGFDIDIKTPVAPSVIFGFVILILSFTVLLTTIKLLDIYYIVKLYKTPNQQLSTHWLFRYIKHPIYYLVLIPELIAICLISGAYSAYVLAIICFITVIIRIFQEERILRLIREDS